MGVAPQEAGGGLEEPRVAVASGVPLLRARALHASAIPKA